MAEYKYFKNFQEMFAYARGNVMVLEPIEAEEVKPAEEAPKKKGRKKKGESDGNIQAD